jgi:NhaP-type Na+/H+ or K+/H+ antiporter
VFILPPIIFAAGYNLKKSNFVKNFGYITLFGVLGTLISFVILSALIIFWNDLLHEKGSNMRLMTKECLLLASVLCATDTVAALSIVKEKSFPTLNSILFGEGVVNDAVAILLFHAVEGWIMADKTDYIEGVGVMRHVDTGLQLGINDVITMLARFLILSLASIVIGIFFGLLCSFVFKKMTDLD